MNADLFERLESAGFGSNVHQIAAEGECRVLRLDDETGEAFMTMYQVFEGIYLMYNDFHLSRCVWYHGFFMLTNIQLCAIIQSSINDLSQFGFVLLSLPRRGRILFL